MRGREQKQNHPPVCVCSYADIICTAVSCVERHQAAHTHDTCTLARVRGRYYVMYVLTLTLALALRLLLYMCVHMPSCVRTRTSYIMYTHASYTHPSRRRRRHHHHHRCSYETSRNEIRIFFFFFKLFSERTAEEWVISFSFYYFVCTFLFFPFAVHSFLSFRCYRIFFVSRSRCVVRACCFYKHTHTHTEQTIATMKSNFEFFFLLLPRLFTVMYVMLTNAYSYILHAQDSIYIRVYAHENGFHHLPLVTVGAHLITQMNACQSVNCEYIFRSSGKTLGILWYATHTNIVILLPSYMVITDGSICQFYRLQIFDKFMFMHTRWLQS